MNTRQIARDVSSDIARDIVFIENTLKPAWSNDFTQQTLGGMTFTRASSAGYTNSAGVWTVAGNDAARFDYDPNTLLPKGLLSEETRTNYLLNSGTPATQTVALSTGTYALWVTGTGSCACAAGTATGTGFGTASGSTVIAFTLTVAGTVVFTVTGSLTRYQCENGAFATSYIATTGAAATRSGDVCGGSLSSVMNAAEGTFVAIGEVGQNNATIFAVDDGSGGSATRAYFTATTTARAFFLSVASVTKISAQASGAVAVGSSVRFAGNYSAAGSTFYVNGTQAGTAALAANGFTAATLRVGSRNLPTAGRQLNGHIKQLAYYAQALSNTQLQQLTV